MSRRNLRALGVVALAVALLSSCAASTWTQVGHDAGHSGHNPDERTITPANVATLDDVWTADLLATSSEPMVRDGRVFLATGQVDGTVAAVGTVAVRAYDLATGAQQWENVVADQRCAGRAFSYADVTFARDELWGSYFTFDAIGSRVCSWREKFRLDPASGARTSLDQAGSSGSPVAYDHDEDAAVRINSEPGPEGFANPVVQADLGPTGPSWTGTIPSLPFPPPFSTFVAPTVRDGMVHAASGNLVHSYSLYGCGADPCDPVWSLDLGAPVTALLDAGTTGELWAAAGQNLVRIERSTAQMTTIPLGGDVSGLALAGETLYVAAGTTLYAFSTAGAGSLLWTRPLSSPATASPVVAGGVVYVGEASGAVEAFDSSGNVLHTVSVTGEVDHVTVAAGKLFVVSPGRLTAFAPG